MKNMPLIFEASITLNEESEESIVFIDLLSFCVYNVFVRALIMCLALLV